MPTIEERLDVIERLLDELGVMHRGALSRIDLLERNFRSVEQVGETFGRRLADVEARAPGANVMRDIVTLAAYEQRFLVFLQNASLELGRVTQRAVAAEAIARSRPDAALDVARMPYPGSAKVGPIEDMSDTDDYSSLEEKPPGPNNP